VSVTELIEFASLPNVILTRGKALYPRYYYMNKGEPSKKGVYRIMAFPRLAFTLIGPDGTFASVLPAAGIESYPSDFPQAAETILLGCNSGEDTSALAVIVDDGSAEPVVDLRTPPAVALQCPLPDPVCQNDQNCE